MHILLQNLRLARGNLLGFGLGLAVLTLTSVLFLPSLKESGAQLQQVLESMPKPFLAAFGVKDGLDMLSPEGFLQGRLFGLMVPLLLLIQGIGIGAATLAGEEERGQLEVLAAHPVARTSLYLQKLGVLLLALLCTSLLLFLSIWIGLQVVNTEIAASRVWAASLSSFLLGLVFGSLALATGAWTGRRSPALGLATVLAVVAYFWNALAPLSENLAPYQKFSPFYLGVGYEPIRNGLEGGYAFILLAISLLVLGLGLYRFMRRDLGV